MHTETARDSGSGFCEQTVSLARTPALARQMARLCHRLLTDGALRELILREPRAGLERAGIPLPVHGDIHLVLSPDAVTIVRRLGSVETTVVDLRITPAEPGEFERHQQRRHPELYDVTTRDGSLDLRVYERSA